MINKKQQGSGITENPLTATAVCPSGFVKTMLRVPDEALGAMSNETVM